MPTEKIEGLILLIRNKKVMIDHDLAQLYGITTKALNQAVKRNSERFPSSFMFTLTANEKKEVVTICDHLKTLKYSPNLPNVFTEHGAIMLANVIKSKRAIKVSITVVQAFIHLREVLATHKDLAHKLASLEKKYDSQFTKQIINFYTLNRSASTEQPCGLLTIKFHLLSEVVFDAIRQLMTPPKKPNRKIGF
ncbi:ORF6N domain-containing protein [bacterium]|nr:ORF6N domain-containing protein [bacterium]